MKDKILALLLAAFAGVRKDGLTQLARILALQAATEEEAKALVDKLTKMQVDEFVKEFRAEVDKEVSEGNKTFETNLKKKFEFVERKPEKADEKPNETDSGDIASIVKAALAAELNPLKQELASFRAGETAKSRLQSLNEKLNGCKDEAFKTKVLKDFGRMTFETDNDFTEYLTDTEKDIAAANQNVANSTLGRHERPWMTDSQNDKKEASKEELDAVIDKLPI